MSRKLSITPGVLGVLGVLLIGGCQSEPPAAEPSSIEVGEDTSPPTTS
jgi:hypothetical protein